MGYPHLLKPMKPEMKPDRCWGVAFLRGMHSLPHHRGVTFVLFCKVIKVINLSETGNNLNFLANFLQTQENWQFPKWKSQPKPRNCGSSRWGLMRTGRTGSCPNLRKTRRNGHQNEPIWILSNQKKKRTFGFWAWLLVPFFQKVEFLQKPPKNVQILLRLGSFNAPWSSPSPRVALFALRAVFIFVLVGRNTHAACH